MWGVMGDRRAAAQAAGGTTFGVIPDHACEMGRLQDRSNQPNVVTGRCMNAKKSEFMNCDAVVVSAGWSGSLDELFEALDRWRSSACSQKPVIF